MENEKKKCPNCGKVFTPATTGRPPVYCSELCRVQAWREEEKQKRQKTRPC